MSNSNKQNNTSAPSARLLLVGATEEQQQQLLSLIPPTDPSLPHHDINDETSLKEAVTATGELIVICNPVVETTQINALLKKRDSTGGILFLCDDPRGNSALWAMRDGARDAISLNEPEHLKLVITRELADLNARRVLQKLLQQESSSTNDHEAAAMCGKSDLLTGLYNQRYFFKGTESIFNKQPPDDSITHSMLYITLDNIDAIHQQVGIAATDLIVAGIAQVIRAKVPASYPVSRYTDYSFAILLHKMDTEQAGPIADTLCTSIASHHFDIVGNDISSISCSIGYASTDKIINSASLLINKSQLASEGAFAAGGNQSRQYELKDEEYGVVKTQKFEHAIRDALKENRFKLLYQPIVNLHSTNAENYEILLRMIDPEERTLLPADFMPAAAQAGLMPAIDRWVTRNALKELTLRRREGKDTSFFIKLDHTTLTDNKFHTWLSERLRTCGLPGDALIFEISERSALRAPREVKQFIDQLRVLRCRCGLDHFGENPGSVSRLQQLPVNFIKIDRTLIQSINDDANSKTKVKHLIDAAHSNEQQAIAEFVQDANTLSALWSCGVDYIQGYFLQRPDAEMDYDFTEDN